MSIGLYDADINKYLTIPYNLEIMKMSAYFKKHHEIIMLTSKLNLAPYQKFIYRKDYYDGTFPSKIFTDSKVEYGGLAFWNNMYLPMDIEIEKQKADISVYDKYADWLIENRSQYKKKFNIASISSHVRMSLDNKNVWNDFAYQIDFSLRPYLFLHDYDVAHIDGAADAIRDVLKLFKDTHLPVLSSKFPIRLETVDDFFNWQNFHTADNFWEYLYRGIIDDEALVDIIANNEREVNYTRLTYIVTNDYKNEKEFIDDNCLLRLLMQAVYIGNSKKRIKFTYQKNFFEHKEYEDYIDFLNLYIAGMNKISKVWFHSFQYKNSLAMFASALKEQIIFGITKEQARELFRFIRGNHPDVFNALYDCKKVELKGGNFQYD